MSEESKTCPHDWVRRIFPCQPLWMDHYECRKCGTKQEFQINFTLGRVEKEVTK